MSEPELLIEMLPHAEGLDTPSYATGGSAGLDLRAALPDGDRPLYAGKPTLIPTGLRMSIPRGF